MGIPGKLGHRSAWRGGAWVLALMACAACGKRGEPLPPEPRGPFPPREVAVRQIGERIEARFRIAAPRGRKPAQQPVRVELVRVSYAPNTSPPPDPGAFRRRGVVVAAEDGNPLAPEKEYHLDDAGLQDPGAVSLKGRTLRYGVRVRDRRGRSSPLVAASDLVPLDPVAAPRALAAQPTIDGVRLTWEAPPAVADAAYNVYRSAAASPPPAEPLNAEPLKVAQFLDTEVEQGATYDYVVRAVLAPGRPFREGRPTPATRIVAVDRYAPAAPERLVAVQEGRAVRLFWDPNREPDLAGYRVYRSVDSGPWRQVGADPLEQASYLDTDVEFEQRIRYRVSAVDRASPPNEGAPCEPRELDVRPEPAEQGSGEP